MVRATTSAIRQVFPDAVAMPSFVAEQTANLASRGFSPDSSLAVMATCRDEIAADLRAQVRHQWHHAFDFSSLSGLPFAGLTGARAVRDHAPEISGRVKIVIWALPHIGVLNDGTAGYVMRTGRAQPTTACGSLHAAASWARDRVGDPLAVEQPLDPRDLEQSLVQQRLLRAVPEFGSESPLDLVEKVASLMLADLWELLEALTNADNVDAALVLGILVHGSAGDFVAPRQLRIRTAGVVADHHL